VTVAADVGGLRYGASMRKTYRGDAIEVTFDLDRCIHVGTCLLSQPQVFNLRRRPWIEPNADDPDTVAAIVERCPSGALQYRRLDDGAEEAHASTSVTPMRNGPLLVIGEVRVRLEDGSEEVLPRAALCRCGESARKPFCDNTHLKIGFQAPGEPLKIRLSPVRRRVLDPIPAAEDPRGAT
jgi:uncharacterized Fe-S cluster protein YjdI/CDGSH-type Zn-finger protein